MCRKLALAATALMLPLVLASSPALAWGSAKPAAPTATKSAPAAAQPAPSSPKASPQDRAAAERMEPLARAAFWASQVSADPKDAEAGIRLASALRAIGRYQEAFDAAGQVLVAQPDNVDALLEQARVVRRFTIARGGLSVEASRHGD